MTEKLLTNKKNGMAMLLLFLAVIAAAAVAIIVGANLHLLGLMVAGVIVISLIWIPMIGLRILKPQEALVSPAAALTLNVLTSPLWLKRVLAAGFTPVQKGLT